MGKLKDLADKLNDSVHCRYSEDRTYPIEEEGSIVLLTPKELLEVGITYPYREEVMIAYFGEEPTRVLYVGENVSSMKKTLADLRLPTSWPSNLGEKVFYHFRDQLEDINSGAIGLEQQVVSGKEHQFELVLSKLIQQYHAQYETLISSTLRKLLDIYLRHCEQQTLQEEIQKCDDGKRNELESLLSSYKKQDGEESRTVFITLITQVAPLFNSENTCARFHDVIKKYVSDYEGSEKNKILELARISDNYQQMDLVMKTIQQVNEEKHDSFSYNALNKTFSGDELN